MRAAGPGGACGRSACVAGRAKARRATASLNAANRSWTCRYESHAARQGGGAQSFAPLLEPQLPYRQHWENHPQGLILMESSLTNNTEATAIGHPFEDSARTGYIDRTSCTPWAGTRDRWAAHGRRSRTAWEVTKPRQSGRGTATFTIAPYTLLPHLGEKDCPIASMYEH